MNPSEDLVIRRKYKYLVDHLYFISVRDYLIQDDVLTIGMCEVIEAEKTRAQQNRTFLGIFLKRGPHAFTSFINALKESGNAFIAQHLEECLTNLEQTESSGQDVGHPSDAASVAASSMQTLALSDTDVETPVAAGSTAGTSTQAPPADSGDTNVVPPCTAGSATGKSTQAPPADSGDTKVVPPCTAGSAAGTSTETPSADSGDTNVVPPCTAGSAAGTSTQAPPTESTQSDHRVGHISEKDSLNHSVFHRKAPDFCKNHVTEINKYYCVPCNEIICVDCALTTHSGNDHKRVDLAQKHLDWRREIVGHHNDIQRTQKKLSEEIMHIESLIINEREKLNELINRVNESQVKLNETIDRYFKEIKIRLCTKSEGNQDILNQRKANIEHNLTFINNLLDEYQKVLDFSASTELHNSLEKLKGIIADDKQSEKSSNVPLERATYTAGKIDSKLIKALAGDVIESSLDYYLTDTGILEVSRIQEGATDVTVTASGNVVVGGGNAAVLYNHLGHKLCTLPRPPDVTPWTPYRVASSADRIFVSNRDGVGIVEYSARGEFVRVLLRGLFGPVSLAVCQDKLVISCWDGWNPTLHLYDIGEEGMPPPTKTHGHGMPGMISTEHIKLIRKHAVKSLGLLNYVTINETTGDLVISHPGGVMAVDTDFAARWSYPCTDSGPDRLRAPWGVATSAGGDVFVIDRDSGRVLRLTQHGQFKRAYQMPGRDGWGLRGVCINDQYVIVLDHKKSQLYKFRY